MEKEKVLKKREKISLFDDGDNEERNNNNSEETEKFMIFINCIFSIFSLFSLFFTYQSNIQQDKDKKSDFFQLPLCQLSVSLSSPVGQDKKGKIINYFTLSMEVTDPEGREGGGVFPRADLNGLGRLVSGYGFGST